MTAPQLDRSSLDGLSREQLVELAETLDRHQIQEAREDFNVYCKRTIPNYKDTPFHRKVCAALMRVERGEIDRLLLEASVRHGKTLLCSQRFPLWYMGRNPGRHVMGCSYGGDLAIRSGRRLRNLAATPPHLQIFPDARLSEDSTRADAWTLTTGGEYLAAGTNGPIMGRGFNLGVLDDLLKGLEAANSEVQRNAVWDWYTGDFLSRSENPHAIIFVTARWSDDDPAARIRDLHDRGLEEWEILNFPALDENDKALAEEVIPAKQLIARRRVTPTRIWQAMYQSNPIPESGDFFQDDWFKPSDRQWSPADVEAGLLRCYGATDAAVSKGGGDWTVHIVVGVDPQDRIHIVDLWRGQETSDVWVDKMLELGTKWKVHAWAEERGQISNAVDPLIRKRMLETQRFFRRIAFSVSKDKKARALTIQGRMSAGVVFWPIGAPWYAQAKNELLRFDAGKNDDVPDALSLAGRLLNRMVPGAFPPDPEDPLPGPMNLGLAREDANQMTWGELVKLGMKQRRRRRRLVA